ncbi:MAG: hypothetical protein V1709_02130 [Planctomycetota bacterium]
MGKKRSVMILIGMLFIAYVTTFNYFGCGGGGGGSGSSNPPAPSAPSVTTQDAIDITINSAKLNGTVNPNGKDITFCYFRYGVTAGYGNVASVTPYPGNGTSPVAVTATLTGLLSETTYHFKLAAASSAGTSYGVDKSFNTVTPTGSPAQVTLPNPASGTISASITTQVYWASASGASSYDAYFGTSATPPKVVTATTATNYNPGTLSYSTTYYWQINSKNSVGTTPGIIWNFSTKAPPPPTCFTNPADNITTVSARLNGQVNPNGPDVTSCYFDYGTSTSYGISATVASLPITGTSPIPVTATVSSLSISTTYNFRIVATNIGGTINGNNLIFTTGAPVGSPPTCTTNDATNINTISARLNGTVNPNGLDTNAYFEYGISTTPVTYPISTTLQFIGNGTISIAVSTIAASLTLNTSYNFRVVGVNYYGTTYGDNLTFTTTAVPPAVDDYCWVANQSSNNVTCITKSDSTTTNIAVGNGPYGVAVDETYCWVSNFNYFSVTRILKSDLSATLIVVGLYPVGVAVDETYCWVATWGSGVTRILKSDPVSATTIAVGNGPYGIAVDATYVWVANFDDSNVTRILKSDLSTTTIAIAVGRDPVGVAVDETYCWVTTRDPGTVTRIRKSDSITTTIEIGPGTNPYGVAVDNTSCWVANYGAGGGGGTTVTRIRKSDLSTTTIAVGNSPYGISVDGTYCWVANYGSNTVTRITKTNNATANIAVGSRPYSLGDMTGYAYDNYSRVPPE